MSITPIPPGDTRRRILVAGQSNAMGKGANPPAPSVPYAANSVYLRLGVHKPVVAQSGFHGLEVGWACNEPVVLAKQAETGTSIDDWLASTWPEKLHADASALAPGMDWPVLVWVQGEKDASRTVTTAVSYADDLAALMERFSDLFGAGLFVYVCRIHASLPPASYTRAAQVRQGQADYVATDPLSALVDCDGLALNSDSVHYSSAGQIALGQALQVLEANR